MLRSEGTRSDRRNPVRSIRASPHPFQSNPRSARSPFGVGITRELLMETLPKGGPFVYPVRRAIPPSAPATRRGLNLAVIGYARVSTDEQHLDLQRDALKAAGCARIFEDEGISAVARIRLCFKLATEMFYPRDTFVAWKMGRAFRSLRHALNTCEEFERRGIEFRFLTE